MSTKPDPVSEVMALAESYAEACVGWSHISYKECESSRAALEAKVRELEKDAARWRWLNDPANEWEPLDSAWLCKHDLYGQNAEGLDAFVDAAIDSALLEGEGEKP